MVGMPTGDPGEASSPGSPTTPGSPAISPEPARSRPACRPSKQSDKSGSGASGAVATPERREGKAGRPGGAGPANFLETPPKADRTRAQRHAELDARLRQHPLFAPREELDEERFAQVFERLWREHVPSLRGSGPRAPPPLHVSELAPFVALDPPTPRGWVADAPPPGEPKRAEPRRERGAEAFLAGYFHEVSALHRECIYYQHRREMVSQRIEDVTRGASYGSLPLLSKQYEDIDQKLRGVQEKIDQKMAICDELVASDHAPPSSALAFFPSKPRPRLGLPEKKSGACEHLGCARDDPPCLTPCATQ